jgi:uncharacterized membrane protein SpoIIM required for sporulation
MLVAPILAIIIAFLLAGSISFLPENAQSQASPHPTSLPSNGPIPTSTVGLTSESNNILVPILCFLAAIVVGIIAAFLLFSEKTLNKENLD